MSMDVVNCDENWLTACVQGALRAIPREVVIAAVGFATW
jgi:hypothetical protein